MSLRSVSRGDVYLADLAASGGRLKKLRPAVVVQNDLGNRLSMETILVGIRKSRPEKRLPIRVTVPAGTGGLHKTSEIDTGQIHTFPKNELGPKLGRIPEEIMREVDAALKKSLALR